MGDRSTSMLFLVVLVFLAFVHSLPLSDKHYKTDKGQTTVAILDGTDGQRQEIFETSFKNGGNVRHNSKSNSGSEKFLKTPETLDKSLRNRESVNYTIQNSFYSDYEVSNSSSLGVLQHRHKRENPFSTSHIVPCVESDRHYCLNAGTCVLVVALDIRTCRCIIPYTGVRCEMIDVVYLFSQLHQVRGGGRRPFHFG